MTLYDDNKEKYDSLPKDLFRLVQNDEEIHDVEFKTKPIGFFMDVWLRFVKNNKHSKNACCSDHFIHFLYGHLWTWYESVQV